MNYADVKEGMEGFGLTIFEGSKPDTFGVEIIGVKRVFTPGQDIIVARLHGERIEETGVIRGMSGSPVYIDGKLIGAISYDFGGAFSKKPICGITPIEDIINPPKMGCYDIPKEQQISLPVCFSNISDMAISLFQEDLERCEQLNIDGLFFCSSTSSGDRTNIDEEPFFPGSSIGVQLVSGDANLGATGTVTHIDGDRVYAFGHNFLGLGTVNLPVSTSHIYTIVSSYLSSFKISEMGNIVGCMDMDAFTGISAQIGYYPSMVNMTVKNGDIIYRYKLVKEERLLPLLTNLMLGNSILKDYSMGGVTYTTVLNINTKERNITLSDTYSGEVIEVINEIADDINTVLKNSFLKLNVKSLEFELTPSYGYKIALISDLQGYVRDDTLFIICTLTPYKETPLRIEEKIPIRNHDDGEFFVITASGRDYIRIGNYDISNFDELISYLESRPERTSIIIEVSTVDDGLLPPSYARFLKMEEKPSYKKIIETEWVIMGSTTYEVEVE